MADRDTDLNVLAGTEIFRSLPMEIIDEARRLAVRKRLSRREALYHQGDSADSFHIVIVGRLRAIQIAPDGSQVALRYLGPGEMAGYAALAGLATYPGTVSAVEDTHLFSWPTPVIRDLMGKYAQIAINALAVLGSRYQETQTRLRELSTETVERRIAHTLTRLAKQAGRRTAMGIEICFPLSRQDFAELAGTSLHTVSRTLSAWEKDGIVSSSHRYIVIHQPDFLKQIENEAS
ncbi:Crp/Fnr family transcriptional regulator [Aquamicrobium segne]|uniref:Crp/Fnr family transcriptional regulator n=1 Tax=Aquamicrobium segne TaxID=469547 RepID=A0ABW0GX27_9HYPH